VTDDDFDTAQHDLLVAIGQALMALSTGGTVAVELAVTQVEHEDTVDLDFQLHLERQSGLSVPASADDTLIEAVQGLVLLWREHGRAPWRTFTYRLARGDTGPRFTSEFAY
jgi:hypothetical protein